MPHAERHNHKSCIAHALAKARERCGNSLTPLREQVLQALWGTHQAKGAYDLLNDLNRRATRKLAPLSIYRALDFLVEAGLAHRLESINAYIGCPHPDEQHSLQFLVCNDCRNVIEVDDDKVARALADSASRHHFSTNRTIVEVLGRCANCAMAQ